VDDGHTLETDSVDADPFNPGRRTHVLPSFGDFLICHSSSPRYCSYRNQDGSWFIRTLCNVLKVNGKTRGLLANMTEVLRTVAVSFESNTSSPAFHQKKQMPCIASMLTKEVYFNDKL
jgi:caspase 7